MVADRDSTLDGDQITDRTIKQLELDFTNTPTDGQIIQINMPTGDFTAINLGSIGSIDTMQTNIVLNAFRIAINGSLTRFNMVDGIVDEYEDENSVDNPNSTSEQYDSVNDLYSPSALDQPFTHFKCNDNSANTTVTDDGSGANNGTANVNTSNYSIAGKINEAFQVNGSTEFIDIDNLLADIKNDTVGSITMWIRRNAGSGNNIFTFGDTSADRVFRIRLSTATLQIGFDGATGSNTWDISDSGFSFVDNVWTHVAIVQDGIEVKIYVNGSLQTPTFSVSTDKSAWFDAYSSGVAILDNGRIGCINRNNSGNILFHGGDIDDIRYYQSVALTSSDIAVIYNSGTGSEATTFPSDMTLISDPFTAEAIPLNARIVLFEEDIDSIILNTDLKAFVTRDAGQTFTTDSVTDDKLDITSHGFSNDDRIMVTSSSQDLPAGLDSATVYYVINATANDFELSLTSSGSAVDITDNGTGTHTAKQVAEITLINDGEYETGKNILTGTAVISGQPSGTSMEYQLVTANTKDLNIHGVGLSWD